MIIGNSFVYQGDSNELIQQGLPCGSVETTPRGAYFTGTQATRIGRKTGGLFWFLDVSSRIYYNMVMLDNKEVILNNKTFDVAQAKKHFSELLGRVAYGGERIIISKRGKPLAVLVPPSELSPEDHLCKAKGWLENDDPFFDIMDQIVSDRAAHTPRILKSKKG